MEVQLPLPAGEKFNPPVGYSGKSGEGTENDPRSICILRLSSIGDVVHTLPVAGLLKKRFPNCRITWVAERNVAPLLKHHPAIDQLLLVDTREWRHRIFSPATWKEILGFLRYLRSQNFDIALDFQGLFKSAGLARLTRAPRRIGMSRNDRKERWSSLLLNELTAETTDKKHIIEKNLAMLQRFGINAATQALDFHIHADPETIHEVESELSRIEIDRFVLINPGGGWVTKLWDADRFAQLIDCVYNDLGLPAIIAWGPGERDLAERIARKCISPAQVSFQTNLSQLIALIGKARLVVSGDTGPLHLASALGVPVVGLYGPTDHSRNGPWNPHDSAYTINFECSPCYQRVCPIGIQCMKRIEVGPVLDAVKKTLYLSAYLAQNQ